MSLLKLTKNKREQQKQHFKIILIIQQTDLVEESLTEKKRVFVQERQ